MISIAFRSSPLGRRRSFILPLFRPTPTLQTAVFVGGEMLRFQISSTLLCEKIVAVTRDSLSIAVARRRYPAFLLPIYWRVQVELFVGG